jgi:hypothetical protein
VLPRFRSKYEETVWNDVEAQGLKMDYEPYALEYLVKGNYYPDFLLPNGIFVEAKGYFDSRARAKMIAVKKNNPDLDIRLLFMNSRTKVRKGSKLTYADWCEKYGFPFADGMIPVEWFKEKGTNAKNSNPRH